MARDYVPELRTPAGLLFIPQVVYEHADSWWNDINRAKLLIRPQSSLAILLAELSSSKAEGNVELPYKVSLFILRRVFFHSVKSYTGPTTGEGVRGCPWPGVNREPRVVASTLTITPRGRQSVES
jgi:hypothetical protein